MGFLNQESVTKLWKCTKEKIEYQSLCLLLKFHVKSIGNIEYGEGNIQSQNKLLSLYFVGYSQRHLNDNFRPKNKWYLMLSL